MMIVDLKSSNSSLFSNFSLQLFKYVRDDCTHNYPYSAQYLMFVWLNICLSHAIMRARERRRERKEL